MTVHDAELELRWLVVKQGDDAQLWAEPRTEREGLLQLALRELHRQLDHCTFTPSEKESHDG